MLYELWDDGEFGLTFCLAGPDGDLARTLLTPHATLVWSVDAGDHAEAMSLYYEHMGWREHTSERQRSE